MKRLILAAILALPFAAMAASPTQEAVREAVLKGVKYDPASAKFSTDRAEATYFLNGREVVVACGAVNAKNASGKYVGEHLYFVSFFPDESLLVPAAVAITHPSVLTRAMNEALDIDDADPKKVVMEGYAQCVVKMLDKG